MKIQNTNKELMVMFVKRCMFMANTMCNIVRAEFNGQEMLIYPYDDFAKVTKVMKIKDLQQQISRMQIA